MKIYCIACSKEVEARLTDGHEIYPHRSDLYGIPFWKCDTCKNYVGCHWKTKQRTKPLGIIATPEIYQLRREIHDKIDPIWRKNKIPRDVIYSRLSKIIGRQYHTGEIRSVEEAQNILKEIKTGALYQSNSPFKD